MKVLFLTICCFFFINANAQKNITTDVLLFGNLKSLEAQSGDSSDLFSDYGAFPIIDKWEFRTETDEWDFGRQQYTLRASFNEFNSKNIYKQINDVNEETFLLFDKKYQENEIFLKYKNIVDLYYLQQRDLISDSVLVILKDKKAIIDFEISNGSSANINELVEIDFAIREIDIDKNTYKYKKELILQKMGIEIDPSLFSIDTTVWVNNTKIIDVISKDKINSNSDINLKSQKLKYRNLELERQNNEAKRILDFAQLSYSARNDLTPIKEFSLGFGINIPTKSSNIRKRSEALVDKLEDELELKQIKANIYQEMEDLSYKIRLKNLEYNSYNKYTVEMEASNTLQTFDLGSDPNSILDFKLNHLKLKKDLLSVESELVEDYLELLMLKGWLLYYPETNFLSNNFKME